MSAKGAVAASDSRSPAENQRPTSSDSRPPHSALYSSLSAASAGGAAMTQ
jgi:hypothetical protein